MPAPPLAVVGRCEQPLDRFLVGEFVEIGRRRQTRKIETQPPNQSPLIRFGREVEILGFAA